MALRGATAMMTRVALHRGHAEGSRRMAERETRIGVVGCGFWSRYQVAGWGESKGARVVAACDRERGKAEALAARFGIPGAYADAEEMIGRERLDVLDVITDPATHEHLVRLAAASVGGRDGAGVQRGRGAAARA